MRRRTTLFIALAAALFTSPAHGQAVDTTCQFSLTRLDATTLSVLALDTNAVYWVGSYASVPGTRIRIDAKFPYSRYMSWNLYDSAGRPIDGLTDERIEVNGNNTNPFQPGADRFAERRSYTGAVDFGARPNNPARNTMYAESSPTGTFWYRVYIPDDGRDEKGGVPLPEVTLELTDTLGGAPDREVCQEAQAPFPPYLNDAIAASAGLPDLSTNGQSYPGRNPPNWRLFVNLSRAATDILFDNASTQQFYDEAYQVPTNQSNSPGFFANRDISYVFTGSSRGFGDLLVLHGRAPTFADTRYGAPVMPSGQQLRYWSFCQYEPATQRVIDCRSDDRVVVGADGYYTIVVSAADQHPANARPECGVTWLAWGPQAQGLLIYRHMLADPSFANAIQQIPVPGMELAVMGDYYPAGEYLPDTAAFEARGCPPT